MKTLVLLAIFCISNSVFAGSPTELNELESTKVIYAVRDAIYKSDLNCIASAHGSKIKASKLDWKFLDIEKFKVSVEDTDQPIIYIKKAFSGNSDVVISVTTNADFTVVDRMVIVQNEYREVEFNVGTITKPVYVNGFEAKVVQTITCE